MHGTVAEVGARGMRAFGAASSWRWDVALYHARIRDEILSVDDPGAPGTSLSANVDETIHAGVEAVLGAELALRAAGSLEPLLDRHAQRLRVRRRRRCTATTNCRPRRATSFAASSCGGSRAASTWGRRSTWSATDSPTSRTPIASIVLAARPTRRVVERPLPRVCGAAQPARRGLHREPRSPQPGDSERTDPEPGGLDIGLCRSGGTLLGGRPRRARLVPE